MSLKQNMNYIKEEISSEEKFFESFFKLEKFYRKYKLIIILSVVGVLTYFIATSTLSYLKEQKNIKANTAYNKVLLNPSDTKSMDELKQSNAQLFEIAKYKNEKDNTAKNDIIYLKQIALYNQAIKDNNIKALDELIIDTNFVLRDYAIFNKALILSSNKEYTKAKASLELISDASGVKQLSDMLKHFLLTK